MIGKAERLKARGQCRLNILLIRIAGVQATRRMRVVVTKGFRVHDRNAPFLPVISAKYQRAFCSRYTLGVTPSLRLKARMIFSLLP